MVSLKKVFAALILGIFGIFIGGCSIEATIMKSSEDEIRYEKSSAEEITPASQQGVVTEKGYRVQSSMNYLGGATVVVTDKKYRVYSTTQSTLYSDR